LSLVLGSYNVESTYGLAGKPGSFMLLFLKLPAKSFTDPPALFFPPASFSSLCSCKHTDVVLYCVVQLQTHGRSVVLCCAVIWYRSSPSKARRSVWCCARNTQLLMLHHSLELCMQRLVVQAGKHCIVVLCEEPLLLADAARQEIKALHDCCALSAGASRRDKEAKG
jgi:hypothetical protein